jgi:Flp pilus assembly pilin Flp
MSILARRRLGRHTSGQSMTEVIIIVFLVGVGCIGLVGLFGDNIRGLFGGSAASLAGNSSVGNSGQETNKTKWTLRGGSLSAYGSNNSNNPSFNPGGSADAPQSAPPPSGGGLDLGGGFNPGGSGAGAVEAPSMP